MNTNTHTNNGANTNVENIRAIWQNQKEELARLRDTARLRMHLTAMEVDDMMQPFEAKLRKLEDEVHRIKAASDDKVQALGNRAAEVVADVEDSLSRLREALDSKEAN